MNLINVVNNHFNRLSDNEKLSILLHLANNPHELLEKDAQNIFEKILKQNNIKNKTLALSKIILTLIARIDYKAEIDINYLKVLDILIKTKPKLNFAHCSVKYNTVLALVFFNLISKMNIKKTQQLSYYKKYLTWISQNNNIQEIYYIDKQEHVKTSFMDYFVLNDIKNFSSLIYHLTLNTKKYNISLSANYGDFLRILFWNYDNDKKANQLRKKIIKNLPLSIFNETFIFNIKDNYVYTILNMMVLFSEKSILQYLLKQREDVITQYGLDIKSLLKNHKVDVSYKTILLKEHKQNIKELPMFDLLSGCQRGNSDEKELNEFMTFCQNHFDVNREPRQNYSFNHLLCMFNYISCHNKEFIYEIISHFDEKYQKHEPDFLGQYPLHYLVSYNTEIEKETLPSVLKLLTHFKEKNINFNVQNNKANTALHIALKLQRPALMIKKLLDCGAQLNIPNKYGKTAYDYTKNYKHYNQLKELIDSHYEKEKFSELMVVSNDKKITHAKLKI